MKSRIMKLAVVMVMITAMLIAVLQFGGSIARDMLAYAGVLGNVRKCKTLSWTVRFTVDEKATVHAMTLEPNYVRAEFPDGKIWLLDCRDGKVILMNPAKRVVEITFVNQKHPHIYDTLRNFKNISRSSSEQIGQRRIDEKQAIGFRLGKKIADDDVIVWLESQSQLPVRIEFLGTNEQGQKEPVIIWSDIVFDVELDESLFKPELTGYEMKELDSFRASYDYIDGFKVVKIR